MSLTLIPAYAHAGNRVVATMGAGSASKRRIQAVNVKKACRVIANTSPPIALRLQATLLRGTSTVFDKQTEYLLGDVQKILMNIETFTQVRQGQNDRPEVRNV